MNERPQIIDSHFHLNLDGMDLDKIIGEIEKVRSATGIETISIACLPPPLWHYADLRQIPAAFKLKTAHPDKTYVFAALDYTAAGALEGKADFAGQAKKLFAMGVDGFKMLEGKPTTRKILKIPMDSPAYDNFYKYLEDKSLPLLAHVADPAICWNAEKIPWYFRKNEYCCYIDGTYPSFDEFRNEALNVARRYQGLKLTLAHFFFASGDIDKAAELLESYPNIAFDLTPNHDMYLDFSAKPDEWRDFFVRFGSRILFGTDNCLGAGMNEASFKHIKDKVDFMRRFLDTDEEIFIDIAGTAHQILGLKLPPGTLAKIYSKNYLSRLCPKLHR